LRQAALLLKILPDSPTLQLLEKSFSEILPRARLRVNLPDPTTEIRNNLYKIYPEGSDPKKAFLKSWKERWRILRSSLSRNLEIYTKEPEKRRLKTYRQLRKAEASLLVQVKTGRGGLKSFLYRARVPGISSPLCDCGGGEETFKHLLLCPRYENQRQRFRSILLSKFQLSVLPSFHLLLTPPYLPLFLSFLLSLNRLEQFSYFTANSSSNT
jgi:hypothetical protein